MIKIHRQAKREIIIQFDSLGCNELCEQLKKLYEQNSFMMEIEVDLSIVKNSLSEKLVDEVQFELSDDVEGIEVKYIDNKIIWRMDRESLDMAQARFVQCREDGFFSPAEFTLIQVDGRKSLDYVFCEHLGYLGERSFK